jgi:hypothetical protein
MPAYGSIARIIQAQNMCNVTNYLILSVNLTHELNPFRPLRLFDLGHIDIVLWAPPERPEMFGFFTRSSWRYLLSAFVHQEGHIIRKKQFTSIPSHWQYWSVSEESFVRVKRYLDRLHSCSKNRLLKYHAARFNCFHVAYRCLELAGVNPPVLPLERVAMVRTITPATFLKLIMPMAHHSVMKHELEAT